MINTETKTTSKLATCAFCGHQGVYGKDIADTDYHDEISGRDILKRGCKDIEACFKRGGSVYAKY